MTVQFYRQGTDSGHGSSYFIKSDGFSWGVGLNHYGQLGDGTTTTVFEPC